jgi:FkbM family methyltransferase
VVTPLVIRLGRHRWLHSVVAALPIYLLADLMLRRFPIQKRLSPGELVYRITSLDQLSLHSGLFVMNEYAPAVDGCRIATFIDLGCNAGWFTLWLTAHLQEAPTAGLLIDAHPLMASEASWHVERNHLPNCAVVHGAAGLPPTQSTTRFHLHPSRSASSVVSYQPGKQFPAKGKIVDVAVPAVSVSDEWRRRFGDVMVDLVKIDIEGLELDFAIYESAFLSERVKRIVLEWHKWCVTLSQLDAQLASIGFERRGVYNEDDLVGLAIYENPANTGAVDGTR